MSCKCLIKVTFTNLKGPLSKTFKLLTVKFRAVMARFYERMLKQEARLPT